MIKMFPGAPWHHYREKSPDMLENQQKNAFEILPVPVFPAVAMTIKRKA